MPLLEVIVCSVADAIEAERGGAGRLEIVRDLQQGGLTPSLKLVREIRQVTDLPVRVMLRESPGYRTNGPDGRAARLDFQVDGAVQALLVSDLIQRINYPPCRPF